MWARLSLAVVALAACGGGERVNRALDAPAVSATAEVAPPPAPKDHAEKLANAAVGCFVGQLWIDSEGNAASAAERSATSAECKKVVLGVTGEDDPSQIEAMRMFEASIMTPLAAKLKELAASDGLDDAHQSALVGFEEGVVSAAREASAARRAAAKIRGEIEGIKNERLRRAARDRVATRLAPSEAAAVPALHATSALEALAHTDGDFAADAHAAALVLALVRVRAAQDLPRHMKLATAAPACAVTFGVSAHDWLKPGAWLAYVTAVAKSCGHPVDEHAKPSAREQLAWDGVLAGFADRLGAAAPTVKGPALAAIIRAATAR